MRAPSFDQLTRGWSAVMLGGILAVAGWTMLQAIDMRDTVKELSASIPLEFHALNERVNKLENSEEEQNKRIDDRFDGNARP